MKITSCFLITLVVSTSLATFPMSHKQHQSYKMYKLKPYVPQEPHYFGEQYGLHDQQYQRMEPYTNQDQFQGQYPSAGYQENYNQHEANYGGYLNNKQHGSGYDGYLNDRHIGSSYNDYLNSKPFDNGYSGYPQGDISPQMQRPFSGQGPSSRSRTY